MRAMYPVLDEKIYKRGIKRKVIAQTLGISDRALRNKMFGVSHFTWPEVCNIQNAFFPDVPVDKLFSLDEQKDGKEFQA